MHWEKPDGHEKLFRWRTTGLRCTYFFTKASGGLFASQAARQEK